MISLDTQSYVNSFTPIADGKVIHRYSIIGTTFIKHVVYEASAPMGRHSTITHTSEYGWLGDMTTRCLPAELEALRPGSTERITAVVAYLDGLKSEAAALILGEGPQDFQ